MKPKFKKGDKCKVIKNLLAPNCIGGIVEITGTFEMNDRIYYRTLQDGIRGIARETVLELVE